MRDELAQRPSTPDQWWDLGCAFEHCVPDRSRALAVLIEASRAGHAEARARALQVARSLRAHVTVAELCAAGGDLAEAGRAYIDAGLRELATEPLLKAADGSPLLAFARGGKFDPEHEIATTLAAARSGRGAAAVPHYVHAARVARAAQPDKLTGIVVAAAHACPNEPAIEGLLVEDLLNRGATTELLDHYRATFVAARTRREYVERMRSAAIELIARDLQPGLALRLLRLALETSYEELLPEVTSHIAAWEILIAHAREQKSLLDLVPLVLKALAAPMSQDDALYLARLGLQIAWREMHDRLAAQPYAATVLDFVDDHPLAIAFMTEADLLDAPPPLASLPSVPVVHITSSSARPSGSLATAEIVISAPPAKSTGRIGVIKATPPAYSYGDDKPVRRAATTAKSEHKTTNRLALLNPPPPRTTTLRRDVSPVPTPPVPARAETRRRAERVVVPIDVVIELPNASFFTTVLRDLSTSGAFVVTKRKLEIGALLGLELRMPTTTPAQLVVLQAAAKIARQTDIGYGIQFVDPSPQLVEAIAAVTE